MSEDPSKRKEVIDACVLYVKGSTQISTDKSDSYNKSHIIDYPKFEKINDDVVNYLFQATEEIFQMIQRPLNLHTDMRFGWQII